MERDDHNKTEGLQPAAPAVTATGAEQGAGAAQATGAAQGTAAAAPPLLPKGARVLLQSLLVAGFVLLVLALVYGLRAKLALASIAASAFIAFGFPSARSARVRFLVGGYVCGVVCGGVCCWLLHALPAQRAESPVIIILFCTLAVFLTSLSMFGLELQHPPANALALSMVLEAEPVAIGFIMLGCIVLLCVARWAVLRLWGRHFPMD